MKVRKLLYRILILCILIGAVYSLWYHSVHIAPHKFGIQQISFSDTKIPQTFEDFKIGFISDFDLKDSEDLDYLAACIEKLNAQSCDMVIFGGDLYETGKIFDEDRLTSLLKSIQAPYGKLAILGENEFLDNLDNSIQLLENGGFEVMRNEAHPIYYKNSAIIFAGLETSGNVDSLLDNGQKSSFVFCAVHQPDYFDEVSLSSASLQLSGHSGGGFIHIPFYGSITKLDGATKYTHGHYELDGCHLYISNGIGMGHDQTARFNSNPNALVITLHKAEVIEEPVKAAPEQEENAPEQEENTDIENSTDSE